MLSGVDGKRVVLGVTGGIAAYKSVELLRLLKRAGAAVRVVLTENAKAFVGPLTFQALSEGPVFSGVLENEGEAGIRHIEWAQEADAVVVAPATANCLGKLAAGIADDALTTFLRAVTCPVLLCPAMNTHMYQSRAVQRNLLTLTADGYHIQPPGEGDLACGISGPGRLPEPETIFEGVLSLLTPKDYAGRRVLITAGPTREPIDPVRFISNPSTGKMGFALARAARDRGAAVILVAGPVSLPDPPGIQVIRVQTAVEMFDAVFRLVPGCDTVVKTAAVSDYRASAPADRKMKKDRDEMTIEMVRNPDILKALGENKGDVFLLGFAAETHDVAAYAEKKLAEKNLDMIAANRVGGADAGFAADTNRMTVFYRDGSAEDLPLMNKDALAHLLLDRIRDRRSA